jgi:hypothetical protein
MADTTAAVTAADVRRAVDAALDLVADVQTARQHLLFSPKHRVELGKIVACVDAPYPPFVR